MKSMGILSYIREQKEKHTIRRAVAENREKSYRAAESKENDIKLKFLKQERLTLEEQKKKADLVMKEKIRIAELKGDVSILDKSSTALKKFKKFGDERRKKREAEGKGIFNTNNLDGNTGFGGNPFG